MTNREKLMCELDQLDNRRLMDMMDDGTITEMIANYSCADCMAARGGECTDEDCDGNCAQWLDMPCRREALLDLEATA